MKTTIQKLNITPAQHELLIWSFYSNWCESVSVSINIIYFQQILANAAINRWFILELQKCEIEFHKRTDRYTENVTAKDMEKCYRDCALHLFNIRPMALLNQIKKPKNTGIRVFNAINQN